MVKVDKVKWGNVWVDGQKYHQVLIIGDQVSKRDSGRLRDLFKTTHRIGDWEQKLLLSKKPEIILIAHGWNGVLKVSEEFKKKIAEPGIELQIVSTPKIVKEYQQLTKKGKKVNVLIHTTC